MARQFTRTRGRLGATRRETAWLFIQTVEATLGGAPTATLANSLNAAALAMRPFTIIRTRGVLYVSSDQVAATERYMGDMAMAVVSDQAVAIGVTAVPTPATDKGSDLFYVYEQVVGTFTFLDATGSLQKGEMIQYDSKAMRRVNDDQDQIVVFENEIQGVRIITRTSSNSNSN